MPTKPPGIPTVDLTTLGSFGFIDDGVFETLLLQPANAPNFFTFEQVQHNGFEQGYNTDGAPQFDTKTSPDFNHSVLLAQVPIVIGDGSNGTVEGQAYRQFLLNINEPTSGTNPFLSLDSLQIWQEESGNLTGFTPGAGFAGAHTNTLVYNLDAGGDQWIGLNSALSKGNGQSDIEVLVPDSSFINDGNNRFVYLYSAFGAQPGWEAGGGFESWGLATPNGPDVPTNAMSISKTASAPGGIVDHVGEVVAYTIEVSDMGNTKLTNVLVTDPSVSDLTRGADIVGNNDNVLDPGEIWSYTAHYTATAADLAGGSEGGVITNVATASSDQTSPVSATTNVFVAPGGPHTTVVMTPAPDTGTAGGELITYAIAVTNDGTADLTEPQVQDVFGNNQPEVLAGGFNAGDANQDGVLNVGETWQFTATQTITQGEIDNRNGGGIPTVAAGLTHDFIVRSLYDQGGPDLGTSSVPIVQNPHVTLTKAASVADGGAAADNSGDVINYAIGLTNDGNMDLTNAAVSDPSVSDLAPVMAGGFNAGDTNHDGELSVGETWQYTADHTVTQAEIDNGGVVDSGLAIANTASATTDQGASATATASVPIAQHPHVTLTKAAALADGGAAADNSSDLINYTIALTNDGNMDLTNPSVSDPSVSDLAPVMVAGFNAGDTNHDGKLSVGETWQYTADHTVTQAEIDNGGPISNTASATTDQGAGASATASVPVTQNPGMTLADTASDANSPPAAGDSLVYTFSLENAGNVTLHDATVTDDVAGSISQVQNGGFNVGDTNGNLLFDPGETWMFTGTYTLQPADLGGVVTDTASATGLGPQNQPVSASSSFIFHA